MYFCINVVCVSGYMLSGSKRKFVFIVLESWTITLNVCDNPPSVINGMEGCRRLAFEG